MRLLCEFHLPLLPVPVSLVLVVRNVGVLQLASRVLDFSGLSYLVRRTRILQPRTSFSTIPTQDG